MAREQVPSRTAPEAVLADEDRDPGDGDQDLEGAVQVRGLGDGVRRWLPSLAIQISAS